MNRTVCIILLLLANSLLAGEKNFPRLPDSPKQLIETLKVSGDRYIIEGYRLDYIKESDVPSLIDLLDSKEPCAFLDKSVSSIRFPGKSTVGHEAAYLIEGFWKRYYPPNLTSQIYKPDVPAMKHWYQMWSHYKKLAEQGAAANP